MSSRGIGMCDKFCLIDTFHNALKSDQITTGYRESDLYLCCEDCKRFPNIPEISFQAHFYQKLIVTEMIKKFPVLRAHEGSFRDCR
jgi:hypothetical protein